MYVCTGNVYLRGDVCVRAYSRECVNNYYFVLIAISGLSYYLVIFIP